jgi:hypothetical protein
MKIANRKFKVNCELSEIADNVYLCTIDDKYDLAMTFCRVQEYYESPFHNIRGKNFEMMDFMRRYSKEKGEGLFTYPEDWVGYNVPGKVIEKCYIDTSICDINNYDDLMLSIHDELTEKTGTTNYYLIGSRPKEKDTIKHEVSHGLYYTNKKYKKIADQALSKIPKKIYLKLAESLYAIGYAKKTIKDEIHAYLSTGYGVIIDNGSFTKKELSSIKKVSVELKNNLDNFFN